MKSTTLNLILALGLTFLLNSCSTPKMFTTLDILRPATVSFAPEVNNVLIVNNSVIQPSNIGHYDTKLFTNPVSIDLIFDSAAIFCTASLRESLENKGFFNSVELSTNNQNNKDNFYQLAPLSKETVKSLCGIYKTDAIISLERIITIDSSEEYTDGLSGYYNYLNVKVLTNWGIYYPTDLSTTFQQYTDSFTWESSNTKRALAANQLPSRYDALVDASILSGSNIADRFIPHWDKEDRYFYAPKDKTMQPAMDSVIVRNWSAAIRLWKEATENSKNNKLKFQAANNIAIAYEISGDIDNAYKYCMQALELYSTLTFFPENNDGYNLFTYQASLLKRKKEIELLNKQLAM